MEGGFEQIPFPRVFRIEQLQKLNHESLVDVFFGDCGLEVWRLEKTQEKLVDQLNKANIKNPPY